MKIVTKICLLLLLFIGIAAEKTNAQVIINFNAQRSVNSLAGLYEFTINNLENTNYTGSLILTLEDEKGKKVLEINGTKKLVVKGANHYNLLNELNTVMRFFNSEASRVAQVANRLPNGHYTFCIEAELEEETTHFPKTVEKCFAIDILNPSELNLIYPEDRENVCESFPFFQWQHLMPQFQGVRYSVKMVEIAKGQTMFQAINHNAPVYFIENVFQNTLSSAPFSNTFKHNHTYAWQVYAIVSNVQVAASEVWEFTIGCKDSVSRKDPDNYILLSLLSNGSSYETKDGTVPFAVFNPYGKQKLNYDVYDISDGNKKLKNLPEFEVVNGLNKFILVIEDIPDVVKGNYYLIKVNGLSENSFAIKVKYN